MTDTDKPLAKSATASPATSTNDSATNSGGGSKATCPKDSDSDTKQGTGEDESDEIPELQLCTDEDSDDDGMPPLEGYTLGEIAATITQANYDGSLAAFRHSAAQKGERFSSMDFNLLSALGPPALAVSSYDVACQWHRGGVTDGEGVERRDSKPRGNTNASSVRTSTDVLGPWRELTDDKILALLTYTPLQALQTRSKL
ncbi:hypothetical protein B0H11DRAFT_2266720 [Mycena galericulata]|nr:hypothetical protein B0H11DRAFT_2266720 [Mycena galericulata]